MPDDESIIYLVVREQFPLFYPLGACLISVNHVHPLRMVLQEGIRGKDDELVPEAFQQVEVVGQLLVGRVSVLRIGDASAYSVGFVQPTEVRLQAFGQVIGIFVCFDAHFGGELLLLEKRTFPFPDGRGIGIRLVIFR